MYFEALKWGLGLTEADRRRGRSGSSRAASPSGCKGFEAANRSSRSVESRIDFDRDQVERAIVRGLRQPSESEIGVAEREMDPRELERRHVALFRVGLELAKHLERLFLPA